MPPMNLSWTVFGRPVKPVAFVLMCTMVLLGIISIIDLGILKDSPWGDFLGGMAFATAGIFFGAWLARSQFLSEFALMAAFFVWGFRVWVIILVQGTNAVNSEGLYLSILWMLLAAGSWLLERSDPRESSMSRGGKWIRH